MAGLSPAAQQVLRPSLCFAGGTGNSSGGVAAVSVASPSRSAILPPSSFDVDGTPAPTSSRAAWNADRDSTPPRSDPPTAGFDDVTQRRLTSSSRTGSSPAATSSTYDFRDDDDGDDDDGFERRRRHAFNRIATETTRREWTATTGREDASDVDGGNADDRGSESSEVSAFEGQLIYGPDGTLHVVEDPSTDDAECRGDAIVERCDGTVAGPSPRSYPRLSRVVVVRRKGENRDDRRRSPVTYRVLDRPAESADGAEPSFLACFICRLSFVAARSLVAHCRSVHATGPDETVDDRAHAVVYGVGSDRTPVLSFLQPAAAAEESRSPAWRRDDGRCDADVARPVSDDETAVADARSPTAAAAVRRESDASKRRDWLPPHDVDPPPSVDDEAPAPTSHQRARSPDADESCDAAAAAAADLATSFADRWRRLNGAVVPPAAQSETNGVDEDDGELRRCPPDEADFRTCPSSSSSTNDAALHDSAVLPPRAAYLPSSVFGRPLALPLRRDSPSHHAGDEMADAAAAAAGGTRFDVPAGCTFGAPTPASLMSRNSCKTLKCPKCNWHYKYQETLEIHMREKHDAAADATCAYCAGGGAHPRLARGETYTCGYKPYRCARSLQLLACSVIVVIMDIFLNIALKWPIISKK